MKNTVLEDIRQKSEGVDSVFYRSIEGYRSNLSQADTINLIKQYKQEALALVQDIANTIRKKDPEGTQNKSDQEILIDQEIVERFQERYRDVFQIKLNRKPNNVEQGRMIDPVAYTKAILIGAKKILTETPPATSE